MRIHKFKVPMLKVCSVILMLAMFATNAWLSSQEAAATLNGNEQNKNTGVNRVVPVLSGKVNNHVFHEGEMRGVWISYITLDMSGTDRSEQAFQNRIDEIISQSLKNGINTLIVHVRSHCDAIYKSQYFPFSHIISGTQGKDPGFDPLEYIVTAAHKAGLEIHAWINPFRVKENKTPAELSDDNPYMIYKNDDNAENDRYIVKWENGWYLNPAYDAVRELIINGVREIVSNYDIDGIHFDDYFYPTSDSRFDSIEYQAYLESVNDSSLALTLGQWRNTNINSLVSGVYSAIKSIDSLVQFGISPQGNISNDENISADVKSWSQITGYVDYICPQIYVSFEHPLLPFDKTCDEWRKLVKNESVKIYCGLALYKAGSDSDEGTWQGENDVLKKEIEYMRECGYDGFMLYSWDYLECEQTVAEMENLIQCL